MQDSDINCSLKGLQKITLDSIGSSDIMNRVEIKYIFSTVKIYNLLKLVAEDYMVLEINDDRMFPYETTYLDTQDYLFYRQHVRGELERHKIRIRKYESTGDSFLEIKKKTNKGRLVKWRMKNDSLPESLNKEAVDFISKYSPVNPASIRPVLQNRFTRITLAGSNTNERITIDFNITFFDVDKSIEVAFPSLAVAEIKKEAFSDFSVFARLIKQLKIYPTGFSKYCVGMALTRDSLKKNNIKSKILLINKIEHEHTLSGSIR